MANQVISAPLTPFDQTAGYSTAQPRFLPGCELVSEPKTITWFSEGENHIYLFNNDGVLAKPFVDMRLAVSFSIVESKEELVQVLVVRCLIVTQGLDVLHKFS